MVALNTLRVVTWRIPRVSAKALEAVTLDLDAAADVPVLTRLKESIGASGGMYVSTCQRVIVVLSTDASSVDVAIEARECVASAIGARGDAARPEVFEGDDAFQHLAEVASSLDSLVPGEPEVMGQIKDAFTRASNLGVVGPDLKRLVPLILRTAKRVRHRTDLGRGKVSLIPLTLDLVDRQLTESPETDVVVIGTGAIGRRMLEFLKPYTAPPCSARLHVVSRTEERAAEIASPIDAGAIGLEAFLATPRPVSLVVLASRARDPYFTADVAQSLVPEHGNLLVLDLAMPRNATEDARTVPGVTLVQLDDLSGISARGRASRERALDRAKEVLDEEMKRVRIEDAKRGIATDIVDLREAVLAAAEARYIEALDGFRARGVGIDAPEFKRWYDRTIASVIHVALARLKHERIDDGVDDDDAQGADVSASANGASDPEVAPEARP